MSRSEADERTEQSAVSTACVRRQPQVGDRVLYHWPRSDWTYTLRTPDVNILEGTVVAGLGHALPDDTAEGET